MIRIAICDDDELIRIQLYNIISIYLEQRNLNAEILTFSSGKKLFDKIKTMDISCLFMDIDLKEEYNGIEIVKRLREFQKTLMIVFVTAFSEYTSKVLSLHTFDYVTKPYKNSDINKLLDDLFIWVSDNEYENKRIKMQFKTIDGIISINVDEILYFECTNRRIDIVTAHTHYHMYGKIREVYEKLKDHAFAVPHISYIVNLNQIKSFVKSEYKIIMTNNQVIPISQLKVKEFRQIYMNYLRILDGIK